VVSAFFTIYAYDVLRKELEKIESMRFLYSDPKFTQTLDPFKVLKFQKSKRNSIFSAYGGMEE